MANNQPIELSQTKHGSPFTQLLDFYLKIDFSSIQDNPQLSNNFFKTRDEVEYRNDISNFSGFIQEEIKNEGEVVLSQKLFCDGTYTKQNSEYLDVSGVNFLNIRSEDGQQNILIRISPIGNPADSYSIIYSTNKVNFTMFENNSMTIQSLYEYQSSIDKAIAAANKRIDIPRQANIFKRHSQELDSEIPTHIKTSFYAKKLAKK